MDLLVGALYRFWGGEIKLVKAPQTGYAAAEAVRTFLRRHAAELNGYEPVASRGSLVALRLSSHPSSPSELCVCNPMTELLVFLPPPAILDQSHVLVPGGRSFHVHVVNIELLEVGVLQVQTYSSETGTWGPVVGTCAVMSRGRPAVDVGASCALLPPSSFLRPPPLVLHGVAYWLCVSRSDSNWKDLGSCYVLALPLDGSRPPAQIKLPDRLLQGRRAGDFNKNKLMLASTSEGKLSLVWVRKFRISLWTLEEEAAGRWRRSTVVDLWRMTEQSGDAPLTGVKVGLECFAERSGVVLFQLYHGTLYQLHLQTGSVTFAGIYSKDTSFPMCAYDLYPAAPSA